ncbi:hypothetical protein ACFSCX_18380 [Bacillus salitolerans]|uniref:Uncharacterized protein n=1 Tax=Bacillus salitolerans TaxID=1437434 RepID=A0ABW4LVQ0_9BACI
MTEERKKISLQDAIKQQLANKKNNQESGKGSNALASSTPKMKSQHTKKPNNQRRKTGA